MNLLPRVDFYGKLGNQILKMNILEVDSQKDQEIVDVIRQRRIMLVEEDKI